MTYNIEAAQSSSISQLADAINVQEPDVVALQEVDVNWGPRSDYHNQIRLLGEKLDMHYYFGEIYSLPPEKGQKNTRKYGLAFLSKYPIISRKNHRITRLSTLAEKAEPQKLRGFIEISISIEGQRVQLFNTHLQPGDKTIRKQQVDDMIPHLTSAKSPFALFGDLNAEPHNLEISKLFTLLNDAAKEGHTELPTFPAELPSKRIDYILYSKNFSVKKVQVANTQASDHRPVIADLTLKLSG